MSDQLTASLERLHNARFAAHAEALQQSSTPNPDPKPSFGELNATASGTAEPDTSVPSRALAARRQRYMNLDDPILKGGAFAESPWVAAAQGHLPHLDDPQHGKPRLAMSARAALAGALALLALGGGIFSAHLLTAQAKPVTVIGTPDASSPTAAESDVPPTELAADTASASVEGEVVIVHVAGAVTAPGIVTLPGGSRVAGAIEAAGGAVVDADLTAFNLARLLVDGEQILIPKIGEVIAQPNQQIPIVPTLDLSQVKDETGRVNINQANSTLLQELPGIGPALAGRIIEYRESIGGFSSISQLQEVSGIGPAVMSKLRDKVAV